MQADTTLVPVLSATGNVIPGPVLWRLRQPSTHGRVRRVLVLLDRCLAYARMSVGNLSLGHVDWGLCLDPLVSVTRYAGVRWIMRRHTLEVGKDCSHHAPAWHTWLSEELLLFIVWIGISFLFAVVEVGSKLMNDNKGVCERSDMAICVWMMPALFFSNFVCER